MFRLYGPGNAREEWKGAGLSGFVRDLVGPNHFGQVLSSGSRGRAGAAVVPSSS